MKNQFLRSLAILMVIILMQDCNSKDKGRTNSLKLEIINVEKEFETAVKSKGLAEAFYEVADENAVIKRKNDTLIKGKENIGQYYKTINSSDIELTWTPDFIYVSEDGMLAYTYGSYLWKDKDINGKTIELKGVFHTIWKRQRDGTWKYVWD